MYVTLNTHIVSHPYGIYGFITALCFAESFKILFRRGRHEMEHLEFLMLLVMIAVSLLMI